MDHNRESFKELAIYGERDTPENRIRFHMNDSVSDVLNQIRTDRKLGPNMQITMNIHGLQQATPHNELLGSDPMWKHFPDGGKVRIETKYLSQEVENEREKSGNMANAHAKLNNIIVIKADQATNATIKQNKAGKDTMMKNFITNDPNIFDQLFNFDSVGVDRETPCVSPSSTYNNQGQSDEAEKLEAGVVETRKQNSGADLTLTQASDRSSYLEGQASDDLSSPMDQVSNVLSCLGPEQHTIEVSVQWDLQAYVSHGLDSLQELATVLTLTGQLDASYINSCENYIRLIWSGNSLVTEFFQAFVQSGLDFSAVTNKHSILNSPELDVSVTLNPPSLPGDRNKLSFRINAIRHNLIETCQCILWLAATCRPPKNGSIHASVARFTKTGMESFEIKMEPLRPLSPPDISKSPCCWLNMFNDGYILAQGFPTPLREYGQGLELPLNIMIEQGMTFNAINHTINDQDCMILKGRYTALVPVRIDGVKTLNQTNEVQWHLVGKRPALVPVGGAAANQSESEDQYHLTDMEFERTSQELTWEDIDERKLEILPIGSVQEVSSKRQFVGYFPEAQILVGTEEELYNDLEDGPKAKIVSGHVINFGESLSLTLGTNAATGGILTLSAGTTITRSKFDTVHKQAQTLIADKLRWDRNKPHILYDLSTRIAWMIPEACLILYLIHYWAVLQSETLPLTPQSPEEHGPNTVTTGSLKKLMPFIKASSNAAKDAADAILREFAKPSALPGHIRDQKEPEKLLYVRDIMNKMYAAIDTSIEHQSRKKPGMFSRFQYSRTSYDLWGYDLADVADGREASIKKVSIDKKQCGGWGVLTDPNCRIVVLFGNNFGELIKYGNGQMVCNQWKSVPPRRDFLAADSGTLEYLQELDSRGRYSIFLTDKNSLISGHRQRECQGQVWPCCNMALQLSSAKPKTVVRVKRGTVVIVGNVRW